MICGIEASRELCAACEADEELVSVWSRARESHDARESIDAYYEASRRALRLVRAYRAEPTTSGRRERECLEAVRQHRTAIGRLRARAKEKDAELRALASRIPRPGLQKARPASPAQIDVSAVVEEIGNDVRLHRFGTIHGTRGWEASAPMFGDERYRAEGPTPLAALVALRDLLADERRREELEAVGSKR
jgi:hypothetical protein